CIRAIVTSAVGPAVPPVLRSRPDRAGIEGQFGGAVPLPTVSGPLSGIRVLDFSRVLSGPHCTRMLSDLGADVIKLQPPDGALTRYASPRVNGLSASFVQQNSGKRNVSIDLASPRGVDVATALAGTCDVLVENYRAGVMERLGLGVAALTERFPRLVYASISG